MNYGIIRNLLQPLIENYFVHGFNSHDSSTPSIKIHGAIIEGQYILITYEDNGSGMSQEELTTLKQEAFAYCYSLESVRFGANVKFIAANAFKGCRNVIIYAPAGSYVEEYANKYRIPFNAM